MISGDSAVPRAFIQCMRNADHGPFSQFAQRAKIERGWKAYELDASHSPNLSAPEALVRLLGQVISERDK